MQQVSCFAWEQLAEDGTCAWSHLLAAAVGHRACPGGKVRLEGWDTARGAGGGMVASGSGVCCPDSQLVAVLWLKLGALGFGLRTGVSGQARPCSEELSPQSCLRHSRALQ